MKLGHSAVDGTSPASERGRVKRAGMTTGRIVATAKKVLAEGAAPTVREVSTRMEVAHNTVAGYLSRRGTSLEEVVARDFLDSLREALEADLWRDSFRNLYREALSRARASPATARYVAPWISQSPYLSMPFTDELLRALRFADVNKDKLASCYDVVLSALCGMLINQSPAFDRDPAGWLERVRADGKGAQRSRRPMIIKQGGALLESAERKTGLGPDGGDLTIADAVATCVVDYLACHGRVETASIGVDYSVQPDSANEP